MPTLGHPNRLVVVDGFSGSDPAEDVVFLGQELRRDDQPNRLAEGFGLRVAEEALGGAIPGQDLSLDISADNRVF
jgi:hypothetical protein